MVVDRNMAFLGVSHRVVNIYSDISVEHQNKHLLQSVKMPQNDRHLSSYVSVAELKNTVAKRHINQL